MAIIAALLATMMMSALVAGFLVMVSADQAAGGIERDQTQAYAAAHAGVEKLTADLGPLFLTNFNPSEEDLEELQTADRQPVLPGITFVRPDGSSGYRISFRDEDGDGSPDVADPNGTQIAAGPYQGLVGLITPYEVEVTARTRGNAEVRMRRTLQTIAIPVFQFGLFSENDLSFHAGDDFSFGGRVHSNSNIFIASVSDAVLTLSDRVTAVRDIIRTHFSNGRSTSSAGYTGTIRMAKAPNCPASSSACRNLAMNEGSLTGNVGSSKNPNWTNISVGSYNSYIRNGDTGGRRLDLPLVSDGAEPIDLIRRPRPIAAGAEPVSLANQRFYNLASLRILLSDTQAELEGLPGVVGTPLSLENATLTAGTTVLPIARSPSTASASQGYRTRDTSLLGGYILINRQDADGDWTDVTGEILALGISGRNLSNGTLSQIGLSSGKCSEPNSDAILRLQRIKDVPGGSYCNPPAAGTGYWPNTLYDPREGLRRDNEDQGQNLVRLGGVMHYIELDVTNFKKWIEGDLGTSGPGSMDITGYVIYFSDRRTNKNEAGQETGELGFEDFVNPSSSTGNSTGNLDTGEDMNGNGTRQTYGGTAQVSTFSGNIVAPTSSTLLNVAGSAINGSSTLTSQVNEVVARANRAVFFRRALKLVNGGLGSLPSNGLQGLTIASENPVYIEGNFNACGNALTGSCTNVSTAFGPTGDAHRSAAVIADAVTLLSRNWNDMRSFNDPHDPGARQGLTTWYRTAIIAGKGLTFAHPGNGEFANFGSDGGAHNFLRFLEDWTGTIYYRGSMVSLFTSRQAVGTWKCCVNVYTPPARGAFFDTEFLLPSLLPPRTPMFRDINTLTFRQILRPTQ
jgi:hypothetical protein